MVDVIRCDSLESLGAASEPLEDARHGVWIQRGIGGIVAGQRLSGAQLRPWPRLVLQHVIRVVWEKKADVRAPGGGVLQWFTIGPPVDLYVFLSDDDECRHVDLR